MKNNQGPRLIILLSLFFFLGNIASLFFLRQTSFSLEKKKNKLFALKGRGENFKILEEKISRFKVQSEKISKVFPAEGNVPEFINSLEKISQTNKVKMELSFTGPPQKEEELFLPFIIQLKTDISGLKNFLADLSGLPYLTRIMFFEVKGNSGFKGEITAVLKVRLYVNEPF